MYNKNQFKKVNDKKVLHKIKKHWAVISVALLGLLGGGAVTTTHVSANANADNQNNNNNQTHQQVNTNQLQNNQSKLVSNNTQSNNNVQSNVNNSNPSQNITKEANQLHSKILMGYMNQANSSEPQKLGKTTNKPLPSSSTVKLVPMKSSIASAMFTSGAKESASNTSKLVPMRTSVAVASATLSSVAKKSVESQAKANSYESSSTVPRNSASPLPPKALPNSSSISSNTSAKSEATSSLSASTSSSSSAPISSSASISSKSSKRVPNSVAPSSSISQHTNNSSATKNNSQSSEATTPSSSNPNQIKTGTYDGLNYEYNPSKKSVEFTGGTLTWNGNGHNAFIGVNDNAPSDVNKANHIKFSLVNISKVTNMSHMFDGANNLQSIDFGNSSNFNPSKVTNMSYMFNNDSNLSSLNFGYDFGTGNVTDMSYMFNGDKSLQSLNINPVYNGEFDTSNVTNMSNMFSNDTNLKNLDLSNETGAGAGVDTANVINMSNMFANDINLRNLSLQGNDYFGPGFDTSKVTNMNNMFGNDNSLQSLTVESDKTKFNSTTGLIPLYLKDSSDSYTSFNPVTVNHSGTYVSHKNVNSGTYDGLYYEYDANSKTIEFTGGSLSWAGNHSNNRAFIGANDNAPSDINNAEHIKFDKDINMNNVTSFHNMFLRNTNVQSIDLSNLNTSHVTNMSNMFESDGSLKSLDLSHVNTNNVTDMSYMFSNDGSLNSLNLSNFDTHNVTDMSSMFNGDSDLDLLDISNFDTRKANMSNFFSTRYGNDIDLPTALKIGPFTKFKNGVFQFHRLAYVKYNSQNNNPGAASYYSDSIVTTQPNIPNNSEVLASYSSDYLPNGDISSSAFADVNIIIDGNGNNVTSDFKNGTNSSGTYYIAKSMPITLNNQDNQQYTLQNAVMVPLSKKYNNVPNFNYNKVVQRQLLNIINSSVVFNHDLSLDNSQNYVPITETSDIDNFSIFANVHENYAKFIQDASKKIHSDVNISKQYQPNNTSFKDELMRLGHNLSEPVNWNTVTNISYAENDANNQLEKIIEGNRGKINDDYNDIAGKYGYGNNINNISNYKIIKSDPNVTSGIDTDKSVIQQAISAVAKDESNPIISNVNNASYEKSQASNAVSNANRLFIQATQYTPNKAHPKLPNIPSGSSSNVQSELNSFLDSMNSSISNSVSAMEASYSSEVANDNNEINSLNSKMSSRSTNPEASTATNDASLQASFSNYVSGTNAEINSLTSQVNSLSNGKTTNPTNPINNNDASEINSLNSKINSMAQNTNVPTSNTNTGNNTALQSSFSNYVKNTNAEINSLNNKISGMAQNTNTPTNNNDASLQSSYNSYVNSTNAEINSLSNKINTSTPTNDASEVDSLNSKINSMKQNIPTVPNYSSLQSSYSNYVSDTNAEISSLNSKISDMSQNTNAPTNNDSAMSAYVDNTNSEISSLTNHINSMPQSNPAPANNNDSALQASYNSYVNSTNAEISSLATEMRDSATNSNYPTNPSEATSATPSSASDLNDLSVGQGVQYKDGVVTRSPMHYNLITINKDCLLHNHLSSVGKITDYAGVLKRGTTVKIIKAFNFKVNGHKYYRYEINLDGNNYYVTANPTFTINTYIMPTEVKNHRRAVISKPCFMYLHGHKHLLRHGSSVRIKRVIRHGKVTRLQLTNGAIITANKRFVKLI